MGQGLALSSGEVEARGDSHLDAEILPQIDVNMRKA